MQFSDSLVSGNLVKRYKRFLADVELADGSVVTAHVANSGSMTGCAEPGMPVWLSANTNPKAKLDWRWEMVDVGTSLVGINTSRPNALAEEAILAGKIPELAGYDSLKREVKYGAEGRSRIDILLTGPASCYVEVKNATLAVKGRALFPDAVTTRGAKHLDELVREVEQGNRAVMLFIVNRMDCAVLSPADHIDPIYGTKLRAAQAAGVEILAYHTVLDTKSIEVASRVDVDLSPAKA